MNSRITGPSPLPEEVLNAVNRPMISHRSSDFRASIEKVRDGLSVVMGAWQVKPLLFTSSGTAAMEATLLNLVKPADKVLSLSIGYYGDLYCKMARRLFGERVTALRFDDGNVVCLEDLTHTLSRSKFDVVLLTHNESATGTLQPLKLLCDCIKSQSAALILVDAVSSVGCTALELDKWKIDAAIAVPQKGLMAPPGASIIALSQRALSRAGEKGTIGSTAFDFVDCHRLLENNMVITTPSLHSIWGLEAALGMIERAGLINTFDRHKQLSVLAVDRGTSMGLSLVPSPEYASPSVTALRLPDNVPSSKVVALAEQQQVYIGQFVGDRKESGIRVGHMGWVNQDEVNACFRALGQVLSEFDWTAP